MASDVALASSLAQDVLARTDDAAARSIAHRTLGLAYVELGSVAASVAEMEAAVADGRASGAADLIAQAEVGLAAALQYRGEGTRALRLAARAEARAPDHPRVALSRGVILERYGDIPGALAAYARAERLAVASDDAHALAKALSNRAVVRIFFAELEGAEADLRRAADIATRGGLHHVALLTSANLGYLMARRGEIVTALAQFDELTPAFTALGGVRLGAHELDRCETLLLAGLSGDATRVGASAVRAFAQAGFVVEAAEAGTLRAQALLVAGQLGPAAAEAMGALRTLRRSGSGPWAALAEEVVVRASWLQGRRDAALARRAGGLAAQLDATGWRTSAASARILAARIELERGRREQAEAQLRMVRDSARAPVGLRVQARCARALLRRALGDRRGARAALRSGWTLLERHRATLGAVELRAGASAHVAELVSIGLEMAIEDGRPREALLWAERGRAGALTPRATAPPEDPALAALLGELRVVAAEADAAAKRGEDSRALLRRQAQVEERVRERARLLPPDLDGSEPPTVSAADLVDTLGARVLVQFVVSGGDLWAVVVANGRFRLRRICTEPQVADEVDGLRVALRRLAFGSPVPQLQAAARDGASYARDRLASLLFDPIADLVADRSRVVVPMGVLHAVPWSALAGPGVTQTVAPSSSLWARAAEPVRVAGPSGGVGAQAEVPSSPETTSSDGGTTADGARTMLVAGPRLAEATTEIAAIAELAEEATVLTGDAATVDVVREAMGRADLVHLACHGHFRADNPLFSSLELHDGALSVFELERLGRAPRQMILSACDAGLSAVHPGDELLGLAAALLRLGTTGIVASVLPVPDAATRRLMVALHERLAAGDGLADALAGARATLDPERDDDLVASWAFQVIGAG